MPDSVAEMMLEPTPLNKEEARIVSDLTQKLMLDGGRTPSTAEEFWKSIGVASNLAVPAGRAVDMARAVLEHLGEEWTEDCEYQGRPSLAAYEALVERIVARDRGEDEDDEDDDATGELAEEQQIIVAGQESPVSTLIEWINDGTLVLDPDWQGGYVWKNARKRRLIESIFLGLPIPPILLFKERDNKLY